MAPEDDKTRTHLVLTKGIMVSHYRIIEKIGAGGMGEVYLAEDTELDRKVALKFLPSRLCQDEDCRRRFRREARAAAKLSHPNIIHIYEVSEYQGRPFFAMEHIEGQSLRDLSKDKELSTERIIELMIQICDGLSAAHEKKVIHRDIKPSNIVVDADGRPKLLDFGLVAVQSTEKLTKSGSILGTIGYMSPEQIQVKDVDQRSDLFSFGVVLYEMITGRLPFKGDTEAATLNSVLNDIPEPLARFKSGVSGELQRIVSKLVEKDPGLRYQNAAGVISDLKGLSKTDFRQTRRISWKQVGLFVGLPVAVIVLLFTVMQLFDPKENKLPLRQRRVAVAVFKNQTGAESLDHLGQMAADWISQGLAQTALIPVVSPLVAGMAAEKLAGPHGIRDFAKATGAQIVVSGNYYRQGDSLIFQTQVTDAVESRLLIALEPQHGSVLDPLAPIALLRQRLMGAFAILLDPRFGPYEDDVTTPPSYEAYLEAFKGLELFTRLDFHQALEHYRRAFVIDSTFTQALFMVALSHLNLGQAAQADSVARIVKKQENRLNPAVGLFLGWMQARLRGDRAGALNACREAAKLAPDSPYHFQWGSEALWSNYLTEAVEALTTIDPVGPIMKNWQPYWHNLTLALHLLGDRREEKKAIDAWLNQHPGSLAALRAKTRYLAARGSVEKLRECLNELITLPVSPEGNPGEIMLVAAEELRYHGDRDVSLEVLHLAIDWYQSRPQQEKKTERYRSGLARSLYMAEEWEEAQRLFVGLHERTPDSLDYLGHLGTIAVRLGDLNEASRVSELLCEVQRPYIYGSHLVWQARIAALLGEKEQAVSLLRQAMAEGTVLAMLHAIMDFEALADYPAFRQLFQPKERET